MRRPRFLEQVLIHLSSWIGEDGSRVGISFPKHDTKILIVVGT